MKFVVYREDYIKNITKHQKDLWAYGISGDLPIILLTIEDEEDINLVISMIKFYSYLKLKGVKTDLVIYNNEEVSYDEPLQNILHLPDKRACSFFHSCYQSSTRFRNLAKRPFHHLELFFPGALWGL